MKNLEAFPGKLDKVNKRKYKTTYKMGYGKLKNVKMFEGFNYDPSLNESIESDDLFDDLFDKLVGPSGPADTKEGEMLRAINKISYRYMNDGDYFYKDYGVETAGSSYIYLTKHSPIAAELEAILNNAIGKKDAEYEDVIQEAIDAITRYIDSENGNYAKNNVDNLDYRADAMSKFKHNM